MSTPPSVLPPEPPDSYQALSEYFTKTRGANPFTLRAETMRRIEKVTERPLICYVTKTLNLSPGIPVQIDDSDLVGISDLVRTSPGEKLDVLIISNGGSAEAAERIVRLLRAQYKEVRFIVPGNAFSAATLICFSGDSIAMTLEGTLGPIDPQINGVPARAILRAFETLEERLKNEGPKALPAYVPLLSRYDLHILEICKSAQNLSSELAARWLSEYMLRCEETDEKVVKAVGFFADYDVHKSHGRSIDRTRAAEMLKIEKTEDIGLDSLVRSLYLQYVFWFDQTAFYKNFECARGINWGRQASVPTPINIQLPIPMPPGQIPIPGIPGLPQKPK